MAHRFSTALLACWVLLAASCSTPDIHPLDRLPAVSGTVFYRERIALPSSAVLEVELLQMRPDGETIVLGLATISNPGQIPIPFRVVYNPARIVEGAPHAVRAKILQGGRVAWITETSYPVLTRGAPSEGLELLLVQQPSAR